MNPFWGSIFKAVCAVSILPCCLPSQRLAPHLLKVAAHAHCLPFSRYGYLNYKIEMISHKIFLIEMKQNDVYYLAEYLHSIIIYYIFYYLVLVS